MRLSGVSPLFEVSTATVDVLFDFFQNILKFGWCVRVSSWGLSTSLPSRQGVGLSREGNGSLCRYFQLVMRRYGLAFACYVYLYHIFCCRYCFKYSFLLNAFCFSILSLSVLNSIIFVFPFVPASKMSAYDHKRVEIVHYHLLLNFQTVSLFANFNQVLEYKTSH